MSVEIYNSLPPSLEVRTPPNTPNREHGKETRNSLHQFYLNNNEHRLK